VAPGEQICAIVYRKLWHSWLSSKHIDKSRLSEACYWSSMDRARDEEDGEDDIVQVELSDVQDLDRDWENMTIDEETFYICSYNQS